MPHDSEALKIDGNCLGIALLDAWRLADLPQPFIKLSQLSTLQDALQALSCVRKSKLLIRPSAHYFERLLSRLNAKRLDIPVVEAARLPENAILLCLRSMRQLYKLPYANGHWVVIQENEIHDQLWPEIEKNFSACDRMGAADVINMLGVTLVV